MGSEMANWWLELLGFTILSLPENNILAENRWLVQMDFLLGRLGLFLGTNC